MKYADQMLAHACVEMVDAVNTMSKGARRPTVRVELDAESFATVSTELLARRPNMKIERSDLTQRTFFVFNGVVFETRS